MAVILAGVALLLFAVVFSLQIPQVQTFIAQKVITSLEERFDGQASFSHLDFRPFNNLIIYDLVLTDNDPVTTGPFPAVDTVLKISSLEASFSIKELRSKNPRSIRKVVINGCNANLVVEGVGKNNIKRILRAKGDGEHNPMDTEKDDFLIRKIEVNELAFNLKNPNKSIGETPQKNGFDWADLGVIANAKAGELTIGHGYVSANVKNLDLEEKCGYQAHDISTSIKVGQGSATISDLYLTDRWSDIHLPYFRMEYDEPRAMRDFIHRVWLSAQINDSNLSLRTLSTFAPSLPAKDIEMFISEAYAKGTINDLKITKFSFEDLNISEKLNGIYGDIEGYISSIAAPDSLQASITAKGGATFNGYDSKFVLGGEGDAGEMSVNCELISGEGSFSAKGSISDLLNSHGKRIADAVIEAKDFDISRISGNDLLREVTLAADSRIRMETGAPSITVNDLKIDKLEFKDYSYTGIEAIGEYEKGSFTGSINSNDPNLVFILTGSGRLDKQNRGISPLDITLDLTHSDVNALSLIGKEMPKASLNLTAKFDELSSKSMNGAVGISDMVLWTASERCDLGDIEASASSSENLHALVFNSSFLDGHYNGDKSIVNFVQDLKDRDKREGGIGHIDLKIKKAYDLLSLFVPGAYIEENTAINLDMDNSGSLKGLLNSGRLAMKEKYLRGLSVEIDNENQSLALNIKGEEANIGAFLLKDNIISLSAEDNEVFLKYQFDNGNTDETKGALALEGRFERDDDSKMVINANTLESNIIRRGNEWKIYPASLSYSPEAFSVDSLIIASADASIIVDGTVSGKNSGKIDLFLNNFNLEPLSSILTDKIELRGSANGCASVSSPLKTDMMIAANLSLDNLAISNSEIGRTDVSFEWDKKGKNLDALISNTKEDRQPLLADIKYSTESGTADASIVMDDFEIGFAGIFLDGIVEDLSGGLKGKITASGPLDNLAIRSEGTAIDNIGLRVSYTNVEYWLDGPFHLTDSCLVFDEVMIKDSWKGTGMATGGITYNNLKDFRMGTHIDLVRAKAIDIATDNGQGFYGNLNATGSVDFSGPFDQLLLDVDVDTYGSGQFFIPLNGSSSVSDASLLSFVEATDSSRVDPYENMMAKISEQKNQKNKGLSMNLKALVNPEIETRLELGGTDGNGLTGRGNGMVILGVRPNQNLQLDGNYILTNGNFHFSALGIANKDFEIQDGSSVNFVGDIMDSELDINAVYKTKASLSTLIADTSSVATRRTVDCGIRITDKISNPEFAFSVDVQDLDPTTRSMVESALSTDDKIQKQFLSLLVTNSFLPDEGTGIVNNSNLLYSNVAQIMAGQLSNMLQRLDIPLDLGLNYQASEGGTNIFDVALSTQLFNNRVVVNGNIGNKLYNTSNASDVVGDLDIEVKLDKTGALRLNLFSHSADQYSNYLDQSQRNGVGIAYQKEFNFFSELFCRKKKTTRSDEAKKTIIIE